MQLVVVEVQQVEVVAVEVVAMAVVLGTFLPILAAYYLTRGTDTVAGSGK